MSRRITIARRAEIDLTLQYGWYLERAGTEIAERYLSAIDETIANLAALPTLGRRRRFRSPELTGIRSKTTNAPFSKHLIFYRADEHEISIERVMHGVRNLGKRLLEDPDQ